MKIELTCISCPMGCQITVEKEGNQILGITGNTCPRGKIYAENEVTHPVRTITTSLPVKGGDQAMVSCRTSVPIPKAKIMELMAALTDVSVSAPIEIGDILIHHPGGIETDLMATRRILSI